VDKEPYLLETLTPEDLKRRYNIDYDHPIQIKLGRSPVCDVVDERWNGGQPTTGYWSAWDRTIYCVGIAPPPGYVMQHEVIHFRQMDEADDVWAWWNRYLDDEDFRIEVEAEAYANDIYVDAQNMDGVLWCFNSPLYGFPPREKCRNAVQRHLDKLYGV